MTIQISGPTGQKPEAPEGGGGAPPIFSGGFRIFFLLAGVSAVVLVATWAGFYANAFALRTHFTNPIQWHAHEMLFGFSAAVIAGFLLTAPANWTGHPLPTGRPLYLLTAAWLAGRVVVVMPDVIPAWLAVPVDLLFLPMLGITVHRMLRGAPGQRHNMVFPAILFVMAAANAVTHLGVRNRLGIPMGTEFMLGLVVLLIAVMGGRVIPGFTRARFGQDASRTWRSIDVLAIAGLVSVILSDLTGLTPMVSATLCTGAGIIHAVRLAGWHTGRIWNEPLLWVLYTGYGWLVVGLFLKAGALTGAVPPLAFRHAFTVGVIGTVVLGMMSRIALGHTGRPLVLPRFMTIAFVLINTAAVLRVFFPVFAPGHYVRWISLSAAAWVCSFSIFLLRYTAILSGPDASRRM